MISTLRLNTPYVFLARQEARDLTPEMYKIFIIVAAYKHVTITLSKQEFNGSVEITVQLATADNSDQKITKRQHFVEEITVPANAPDFEVSVLVKGTAGFKRIQDLSDPSPDTDRITTVKAADAHLMASIPAGDVAYNCPHLYLTNPFYATDGEQPDVYAGRCIVPVYEDSVLYAADSECQYGTNPQKLGATTYDSLTQTIAILEPAILKGLSYIPEDAIGCNGLLYRDTGTREGNFKVIVKTLAVNNNVIATKNPPTTGSLPNQSSDTKPNSFFDQ
jgi:hypothetical protein